MKKLLLAVSVFACALQLAAAPASVDGRIVKYPLNVRAGAGTNYNIVGKLTKHNPVKIVAVGKDFLKIAAPANCRVWVMKRYIKNNRLTANVNLRSGPGTGFENVGSGKKGMSVKIGGQATASGWVPLIPPGDVTFYVGRQAIEADAQKLAKLPKFTNPGPRAPDKALCDLESNYTSAPQAVTVKGYIYKEGTAPVTHVLFEASGNQLQPKFFLVRGRSSIKVADGAQVSISGDRCTVKNWDMPVIIVHHIKVIK